MQQWQHVAAATIWRVSNRVACFKGLSRHLEWHRQKLRHSFVYSRR